MSNKIDYLKAPDLNSSKTADLMMLRSTSGLDQVHVPSEKIEAIARESLNPIRSSSISSTPSYLETSDSNFRKTAQELMLDEETEKIAAHALLSLKNPSSSYPNTSNPDQGLFLSGSMLVRTESKPPQPTNDEECDPLNPLLSKKVKGSKAPLPSTSYLYPAENSPNQNQNRLSPKDANPQLMGISDREWFVVESLLRKKLEWKGMMPRSALNSILLIAINGVALRSIPTKTNFCKKDAAYRYFHRWRSEGTFGKALRLLADKTQDPLQPYYRSLLNNFQTLSKKRGEQLTVEMLRNLVTPPESVEFQGITDEEWTLVEPLLSKKDTSSLRPILNSIFLILIDGSISDEIPLDPNFVRRDVACENFYNWRKTGIFEEVLVQLIGVTQDPLQSNYQNLLDKLKANPYSKTGHLPISKLRIERAISLSRSSKGRRRKAKKEALSQGSQLLYDFMSNDTPPPKISKPNFPEMKDLIIERPIDGLNDCENSPNQNQNRLSAKDANPQLMGISDREWFVVESLFRKKLQWRGMTPRFALNSILLIAINGVAPKSIPTKTNFCKKDAAHRYFHRWRSEGNFGKALRLLADKTQDPLQPYYRSLFNNFQTLSKKRVEPLTVEMLRNLMSHAESEEFQGITDEEWTLVEPLLSKNHTSSLRPILNSIFLILIDGSTGNEIPSNPNFAKRNIACENFYNWRKTGIFEEVLVQLIGVTQGSLQSNYQNLLDKLKTNPYSKTGHLPISKFRIERAILLSRSSKGRRRKARKEALSQGSQLSYDFMSNDTPPSKISKPNFPEMTDLIMDRPIDDSNDCVEKIGRDANLMEKLTFSTQSNQHSPTQSGN